MLHDGLYVYTYAPTYFSTLSNNDNAKLIGQKGLKYVNSLSDQSSPIINKINTFF